MTRGTAGEHVDGAAEGLSGGEAGDWAGAGVDVGAAAAAAAAETAAIAAPVQQPELDTLPLALPLSMPLALPESEPEPEPEPEMETVTESEPEAAAGGGMPAGWEVGELGGGRRYWFRSASTHTGLELFDLSQSRSTAAVVCAVLHMAEPCRKCAPVLFGDCSWCGWQQLRADGSVLLCRTDDPGTIFRKPPWQAAEPEPAPAPEPQVQPSLAMARGLQPGPEAESEVPLKSEAELRPEPKTEAVEESETEVEEAEALPKQEAEAAVVVVQLGPVAVLGAEATGSEVAARKALAKEEKKRRRAAARSADLEKRILRQLLEPEPEPESEPEEQGLEREPGLETKPTRKPNSGRRRARAALAASASAEADAAAAAADESVPAGGSRAAAVAESDGFRKQDGAAQADEDKGKVEVRNAADVDEEEVEVKNEADGDREEAKVAVGEEDEEEVVYTLEQRILRMAMSKHERGRLSRGGGVTRPAVERTPAELARVAATIQSAWRGRLVRAAVCRYLAAREARCVGRSRSRS